MSIIQKTFNDLYNEIRNHGKSAITNPSYESPILAYDGRIQYLFKFFVFTMFDGPCNILPKDGERF